MALSAVSAVVLLTSASRRAYGLGCSQNNVLNVTDANCQSNSDEGKRFGDKREKGGMFPWSSFIRSQRCRVFSLSSVSEDLRVCREPARLRGAGRRCRARLRRPERRPPRPGRASPRTARGRTPRSPRPRAAGHGASPGPRGLGLRGRGPVPTEGRRGSRYRRCSLRSGRNPSPKGRGRRALLPSAGICPRSPGRSCCTRTCWGRSRSPRPWTVARRRATARRRKSRSPRRPPRGSPTGERTGDRCQRRRRPVSPGRGGELRPSRPARMRAPAGPDRSLSADGRGGSQRFSAKQAQPAVPGPPDSSGERRNPPAGTGLPPGTRPAPGTGAALASVQPPPGDRRPLPLRRRPAHLLRGAAERRKILVIQPAHEHRVALPIHGTTLPHTSSAAGAR